MKAVAVLSLAALAPEVCRRGVLSAGGARALHLCIHPKNSAEPGAPIPDAGTRCSNVAGARPAKAEASSKPRPPSPADREAGRA